MTNTPNFLSYALMWQGFIATSLLLVSLTGCSVLRQEDDRPEISDPLPEPVRSTAALIDREDPQQRRDWRPELAVLPYAEIDGTSIELRNVRACRWRTVEDYDVRHRDWQFDLEDVIRTDFIVVPFANTPSLAHTMLSFGLRDGRYLILSVEARLEAGESYSPLSGVARQYELMFVLGDETDLLGLRVEARDADVYIYRSKATPEQSAEILRRTLVRANQLAKEPEHYDTLRNNCTTNLADLIEFAVPDSLMNDWRLTLPGHSDKLAYDLRLLDTAVSFEELQKQAFANVRIQQYLGEPNFSELIRQ